MDQLHPTIGNSKGPNETVTEGSDSDTGTHTPVSTHEFWGDSRELEAIIITVRPPMKPLSILEKLGPSPFERGGFPLIGFLATSYDKVSQFALERAGYQSHPDSASSTTDIPNV